MLNRSARRLVIALATVLALASGCSSSAEPLVQSAPTLSTTTTSAPTTTTAAEPEIDQASLATDYFADLADYRLTSNAEPGSLADTYAWWYVELNNLTGQADTVEAIPGDDQVTLRATPLDGSPTYDVVYSDLVVSSAGLQSFAVNGTPLADLVAKAEPATSGEVTVDGVLYRTTSGHRIALLEVSNHHESDSVDPSSFGSPFVGVDGRQETTEFLGGIAVQPGATGLWAFILDDLRPTIEGDLQIEGFWWGPNGENVGESTLIDISFG